MPTKQILPIEEFSKKLILTGDLDPVYIALSGLLDHAQTLRWLTAYFCYYNAGVACWMSEFKGTQFWEKMFTAAKNWETKPTPFGSRWPRGAERRHFRGEKAGTAVCQLQARYPKPELFIGYLAGPGRKKRLFANVRNRVQEHFLFGNWVAYKCADILERVLRIPIDFSTSEVFMYKEPADAAIILWEQGYTHHKAQSESREDRITAVITKLGKQLHGFKAPPNFDRPIGVQEEETCACKWKSQLTGYYVGKDIHEIRHGLQPWLSYSPTAVKFLANMPEEVNPCQKLW